MSSILVFRKASEVKYSKASAETVSSIIDTLAVTTRVQRPGLTAHLLPTSKSVSAFAKQETVTRAELHKLANFLTSGVSYRGKVGQEMKAILAKAYTVDSGDLGRAPKNGGERDWKSTGQSILLYAKDRIGQTAADHGVTVVDTLGSDISVVVGP